MGCNKANNSQTKTTPVQSQAMTLSVVDAGQVHNEVLGELFRLYGYSTPQFVTKEHCELVSSRVAAILKTKYPGTNPDLIDQMHTYGIEFMGNNGYFNDNGHLKSIYEINAISISFIANQDLAAAMQSCMHFRNRICQLLGHIGKIR